MNATNRTADNRDILLEAFAADLATAAYRVALRHGAGKAWVDLELDLWRVLIETVRQWDGVGRGRNDLGERRGSSPPSGSQPTDGTQPAGTSSAARHHLEGRVR